MSRSHERKKVQVSRELACQVQIILTDQDDESLYEETFEKWQEEMSADSYKGVSTIADDDDDSDENDSENDDSNDKAKPAKSSKKKDSKKKFTPLLNPDFNKSIHTVSEEAPSMDSNGIDNSASTPVATSPPAPPVHDKPLPPTVITLEEPASAEKVRATAIPEEQPTTPSTPQQTVVTGLKRLLSIGKKNKPATPEVSVSNSEFVQDTQYHVLRIFAGNINVGALFSTVAVTPEMNADQLLKLALQKFHIPLLDSNSNKSNDGIEYYLTVKSMDSGKNKVLQVSPSDVLTFLFLF
ncbi:hypothetical protein G6F42_025439 [Rhizopus arrhizus]|nr:hypothetical protein G6F42_025439 [Rhizopus arrhizus]